MLIIVRDVSFERPSSSLDLGMHVFKYSLSPSLFSLPLYCNLSISIFCPFPLSFPLIFSSLISSLFFLVFFLYLPFAFTFLSPFRFLPPFFWILFLLSHFIVRLCELNFIRFQYNSSLSENESKFKRGR